MTYTYKHIFPGLFAVLLAAACSFPANSPQIEGGQVFNDYIRQHSPVKGSGSADITIVDFSGFL